MHEAFDGIGAVSESFGQTVIDVPVVRWHESIAIARDQLGCTFFDFLTAVDEAPGLRLVCRLVRRPDAGRSIESVLVRTDASTGLASVADLYAGARWHERETAEMFGIVFTEAGTPIELDGLLLPEGFDGHPLLKDFALTARDDKAWPGAKR